MAHICNIIPLTERRTGFSFVFQMTHSATERRDPHLRYYSVSAAATSTLTMLVISEACFWEGLISLRNFNSLWNPKSEHLFKRGPPNDRRRRQTESQWFTVQARAELTGAADFHFQKILDVLIEIPVTDKSHVITDNRRCPEIVPKHDITCDLSTHGHFIRNLILVFGLLLTLRLWVTVTGIHRIPEALRRCHIWRSNPVSEDVLTRYMIILDYATYADVRLWLSNGFSTTTSNTTSLLNCWIWGRNRDSDEFILLLFNLLH